MRPKELITKIFLDSGDPAETETAISLLGFLDGQTTNPTYFAKSPAVQERLRTLGKFSRGELLSSYRQTIEKINKLIPQGSISIEVYADRFITSEQMFAQAKEMFAWIPNAHIKFPIISEGMKAAYKAVEQGMRVNMTLCFTQEQAAAVHTLTRGAKKGQVYVSPFMGRHFDAGANGLDLIKNIIKMFKASNSRVEVLAASLRNIDQFYGAIRANTDIITAGMKFIKMWAEQKLFLPDAGFVYEPSGLRPISYQELDLSQPWTAFDIKHEMTDKGLEQFSTDWNNLIND